MGQADLGCEVFVEMTEKQSPLVGCMEIGHLIKLMVSAFQAWTTGERHWLHWRTEESAQNRLAARFKEDFSVMVLTMAVAIVLEYQ